MTKQSSFWWAGDGKLTQPSPVLMCILNAFRRCHGEQLLGRRAAVCLLRLLPSIQPAAYLIQHVISSCVRLRKGTIQEQQRVHSIPNRELTYFNRRGKRRDHLGKGQTTSTIVRICCRWKWWDTTSVLNAIHWHWNMRGLFQGKFQFDKTSCGRVRPAYWDKCTRGIENETLHQLDSCPLQHILNSSLLLLKKIIPPSTNPFHFPLPHQT